MIQIRIKNEFLDIDNGVIVTFKKSQQLNGIQGGYSYSNNINLKPTSKNLRLLGINYLPNSKAKSMTLGYDCDVILNGCIFLKKQKLKVQKESQDSISIYLVFYENLFVVTSKEILLNSVDLGYIYERTISNFSALNIPSDSIFRTAPISAQDESGLVVLQEVPELVNIVLLIKKIITKIGYFPYGDFFEDENLKEYYTNPNSGIYVNSSDLPFFDEKETCFEFLEKTLKTFNAYIEISDSEKAAGIFLWRNIESIKSNFVDYSDKYIDYTDYSFEGSLAKKNIIEYSDSPPFFNSFFENNKSIVEKATYLKSDFGAGSMRLFEDQEINDDNTIDLRTLNELGETSSFNLYKFEATQKMTSIWDNGIKYTVNLYRAFSPNIFEIFEYFHLPYTKNISLPTIGILSFRYDAIFVSKFKMQQVFFIKNLASYWLPLEINFTTDKDKVTVKSLMIEKTTPDVPLVYDLNVVLNYLQTISITDANDLYYSTNTSPQSIFVLREFDNTKNRIYVTGSDNIEVEVLALPYTVDVTTQFIIKIEAISVVPAIENSDLLFQFISEEGGISRVGKINIQNRGRISLLSEFKSPAGTEYAFTYDNVPSFNAYVNRSQKITTLLNIPDSLSMTIGDVGGLGAAVANFKALDLVQNQNLKLTLSIGEIYLYLRKYNVTGGIDYFNRRLNLTFDLYKNGVFVQTLITKGLSVYFATDIKTANFEDLENIYYFNALAGDEISIFAKINGTNGSLFAGNMDAEVKFKNVNWKFECFQQL